MLGKKVRELRKNQGLTLAQLSEKLDISESYLSQLECGRIDPSISLVRKLATEFQVPIAAFFEADYEEPIITRYSDRVITITEDEALVVSMLSPDVDQLLLSMREFQMKSDASMVLLPNSFHTCLYVTEGSLCVKYSDTNAELSEGDSIYLPLNLEIALCNKGAEICKGVLCTRTAN